MNLADELAQDTVGNWQEATLQQQNDIEREIANKQSLISCKQPVSSLCDEYTTEESAIFAEKARELAQTFTFVRRVRGDGNCFYRALAFALCGRLIMDQNRRENFLKLVNDWKKRLIDLGFPQMTTEDFCDTFADTIAGFKTEEDVLETFSKQAESNYLVVFMRLVTSGFMQENADRFIGFIEGGRTLVEYCHEEVEPMAKECDNMCIVALCEALQIPLRIEYMDRSLCPNLGKYHDFGMKEGDPEPEIHFLYRPGHYDILYK